MCGLSFQNTFGRVLRRVWSTCRFGVVVAACESVHKFVTGLRKLFANVRKFQRAKFTFKDVSERELKFPMGSEKAMHEASLEVGECYEFPDVKLECLT